MVYVDEKGQKYEFQYCVVLREGKDAGLKHYVWASEEQIRNAMSTVEEKSNCKEFPKIRFGHSAAVSFKSYSKDKGLIGSLELEAEHEEKANELADYLSLPIPFPNKSQTNRK